ncbi:MAG: proton-conducting transporter membrane subunit [Acidobacteriota bacterium]|nr:proton-conducting transporter membrane subunit [Acidobacteriota bacterium]
MSPMHIFVFAMSVLGLTSVLALLCGKQRLLAGGVNLAGVLLASVAMFVLAVRAMFYAPVAFSFGRVSLLGLNSEVIFQIDVLSAIFLMIICVLATASALYSIRYIAHYHEDPRRYYFPFPLFIAGMMSVVCAADWFWFLVFWEVMTLASYFLVMFENVEESNLKAGFIYFFMTQMTSMGLMLGVILLGHWAGSTAFAAAPPLLLDLATNKPLGLTVLLFLFFLAFATKAGMYPLGIWLPLAHPAAPASISALLSGVMIKLGVYGLLRIFVWQLPLGTATHGWGILIASFGVLSMLIGTLRALGEHDCKRLLAQHSIGQMGYVLLGLGMGMALMQTSPLFAMIAFAGCLYHIINHACFKSLLFFNSGAILHRTGTRDLDSLGGLAGLMPVSAACGLVGALSIAGTPPFNGFVSKWLLYQSTILGDSHKPLYVLFGVAALFISTVTLASFVKYLGTSFLGTLPERFAQQKKGGEASMEIVEIVLAVLCFALGVVPGLVMGVLQRALQPVFTASGLPGVAALPGAGTAVPVNGVAAAAVAPAVVLLGLLGCIVLVAIIHNSVKVPVRAAAIWNCGELIENERVRYRASSFYRPFKEMIHPVYEQVTLPTPHVPKFVLQIFDVDRWLYFPVARFFTRVSRAGSRMHNGAPQLYLLWQVIGCAASIALVVWLMGGVK